jgi:hypothetical protein
MKELVNQYKAAKEEIERLYSILCIENDGFVYHTKLRCYGSISWQKHSNQFTVQELCDEFYGDNGIVDVYTTNPNHEIHTYGSVNIVTLEELKDIR